MSVTVRQRTDTKEPAWQVDIKAMPPGSLKAKRYRYTAPRSITSKSGAQRWGEQMRREIEAGKPPPQSREGREEAKAQAVEEVKPDPKVLTLREAAAIFIEDSAGRGNANGTLTSKRSRLVNILDIIGGAALATAGEAEASKLRAALRARGMAVSTINAHVHLLQSIVSRCHALGYRPTPCSRLELVSERRVKVPKAYDDATFETLVQVAATIDADHLALVLLAGEAGLRAGELCGLEVRDLDARGFLHVERSVATDGEIGPPKNGETRVLPLTARTLDVVTALAAGRDRGEGLIAGRLGRLTQADVRTLLRRCQRGAGLPAKGVHVLRHTAASSALAGGADVVSVQRMLGHRSPQTTLAAYAHDTGEAPQRAIDALASARSGVTAVVTDWSQVPRSNRKPRQKAAKGVSAAKH